MIRIDNHFIGKHDKHIQYYKWVAAETKAVVQVMHGMGEHAMRYERLAEDLVPLGFTVYANDHRGHGRTAKDIDHIGYFEDGDFWNDTQDDLGQFNQLIRSEYPDTPLFILGHSMGSLLARDYISNNSDRIHGVILSGTGGDPGFLGRVGLMLSKLLASIHGRDKRSEFLRSISFGKFNKEFAPMRTKADWISKDKAVVDKYVTDEMCSKTFTSGFWIDLLNGVTGINKAETFNATSKELPIYMFSGDRDPVGDFGKGVTEVFEKYKKAGIKNIQCTLYPNGRHEMLNEVNRDEVIASMVSWMHKLNI